MSDSLQTVPRNSEASVNESADSLPQNVPVTVNNDDKNTLPPSDDSVFVSPGITGKEGNCSDAATTNYIFNPVQQSLNQQTLSEKNVCGVDVLSDSTKPMPMYTVAQSMNTTQLPSSATFKTVFVVAPSTVKGVNLRQVAVPGHGVQLAIPCNNPSISAASSVLVNDPITPVFYAQQTPTVSLSPSQSRPDSASSAPLTPLSAPINKDDPFLQSDQIPVTCRKKHAILDRRKLGSGNHGRCILFEDTWLTPNDFESESGLKTSKDWKRSIRYAGCSVQNLINDGFLKPHSSTCTCAVCSDDDTVTCPIRLFQPYKRRKRNSVAITDQSSVHHQLTATSSSGRRPQHRPLPADHRSTSDVAPSTPSQTNAPFQIPVPSSSVEAALLSSFKEIEASDLRLWRQLEEVADNLLKKAEQLKTAVNDAKVRSLNHKTALLHSVMTQFTEDKMQRREKSIVQSSGTRHDSSSSLCQDALHQQDGKTRGRNSVYDVTTPIASVVPETQSSNLVTQSSNLVTQSSNQIAGQVGGGEVERNSDVTQPRFCKTCGNPAMSECTGCRKAFYCSTACQRQDWLDGHSHKCLLTNEGSVDKSAHSISVPSSVCAFAAVLTTSASSMTSTA